MSITYEIEVNGDMLRVKASGADDHLDEVKQYGIALIAAAIQNQCVRVLCDESDLQYRLGTIDTFELGQYIAENAPRIAKIAIVCKAEIFRMPPSLRPLQPIVASESKRLKKWKQQLNGFKTNRKRKSITRFLCLLFVFERWCCIFFDK
jgi:hypothetical protein